jgi:hypothetical protein
VRMCHSGKEIIRKIPIQASCGSRKELAVTHGEMAHRAEAAWHKGHDHKRYCQDYVAPRTPTGRTSRMRRTGPKCNTGMKDGDLKQKLQGSKRIKDLGGRLYLCPRNETTSR